jgi:hypothetical protein
MSQTNRPDPSSKFLEKLTYFIKLPFNIGIDLIEALRIFLFLAYTLTGILRFWIWVLEKVLFLMRLAIRFLTVPLGIISGVHYSSAYLDNKNRTAIKKIWSDIYANILASIAIELRTTFIVAWVSWAIFWRVSISRKIILLVTVFSFVMIPLGYIIPRPEYIRIEDTNSIADNVAKAGNESYIILATGFDGPDDFRQYANKDAWWLTKFNSQRIKTILKPGKSYQIWIIGYRITVPVEWYPNIVYAVECEDPKCGL